MNLLVWTAASILAGASPTQPASMTDTTYTLERVEVSAPLRQVFSARQSPLSSTQLSLVQLAQYGVESQRDFAQFIPNLHIPDYGSQMTSTLYVRGMGSRIDNPVMGMYVNQIPIFNKNAYDTRLWDLSRVEVLRGPQSTLFGRNTMGGLINIYTLSPFSYKGWRVSAGYGSANSLDLKGSYYGTLGKRSAITVGGYYNRTDGYFRNHATDKMCDDEQSGGGRVRYVWKKSDRFTLDNTLLVSYVDGGGYAYALYDKQHPTKRSVSYNDPSSYRRTSVIDGVTASYRGRKMLISSVTSYQYLDDVMILDQDFTPQSMFTLRQAQQEHTVTQDFTVRRARNDTRWKPVSGISFFYKHLKMQAPVSFKKDGVQRMILDNINKGISSNFPGESILFREEEFEIGSDFTIPTWGAAIYHQSSFTFGRFTATAGVRFDYEHAAMDYDSRTGLQYRFTMTMPEFRAFGSRVHGREKVSFHEWLPSASLRYSFARGSNIYASFSKGYKSGGFNTQMFSDIISSRMETGLMADLGVSMSENSLSSYSVADIVTYKPEFSYNYEIGAHLNLFEGAWTVDLATFRIDCRDQQLTVFPNSRATGRMMTNAGRTRSWGAEIELAGRVTQRLLARASYGYTHAEFRRYHNGKQDFAGNRIPYAPEHTVSGALSYTVPIRGYFDRMIFNIDYSGAGRIWWDETNQISQRYYSLWGSSIELSHGDVSLKIWGKNIFDKRYDTFRFVSVGNTFLAQGKPARWGVTVNWNF